MKKLLSKRPWNNYSCSRKKHDVIRHIIWDFDGTLFDTYTAITGILSEVLLDAYGVRLDKNNILKEETLVIGDRELDVEGGKNAGMRTFLFNSNNLDMRLIQSDYKAGSLKDVLALLV